MCRHVKQSEVKKTSWVLEMLGVEPGAPEEPEAPNKRTRLASKTRDSSSECFHGYEFETNRAWRQTPGTEKVYAELFVKDNSPDDAHPFAKFGSDEVEIVQVTVREYKDHQAVLANKRQSLWEGKSPGKGRLRVARPLMWPILARSENRFD